jgi:hypothetical protein
VIPGLQQYVQMFVTQAAPGGPLSRAGLIPLSADLHATSVRTAADLPLLTAAQLN